ncbi:MAG: transposase [Cyclobacteriaceae bacterium]
MSELRKANTDHPYFITFTIAGWIDLFTRERYCEIIIESLRYCIANKGLKVFHYVIMPSHLHIIAQHHECKLAEVIRDMKSFTAKEILKAIQEPGESRREWLLYLLKGFAKGLKQNKEFVVWQKTNHPTELSQPQIYDQKVEIPDNESGS